MTDQSVEAWKRLKNFEYRTFHNFLRDQYYVGNWVEIHVDSNGAGTGASFTVPATQTFWFVAGQVANTGGGSKEVELRHDADDLETADLLNGTNYRFVLPIDGINAGETMSIENVSGAGGWHSSLYGYVEAQTRTDLHTTTS